MIRIILLVLLIGIDQAWTVGAKPVEASVLEQPNVGSTSSFFRDRVAQAAATDAASSSGDAKSSVSSAGLTPSNQASQNDNTWVALLSRFGNVMSVFFAAGLAFLAAQYNERKSWRRRKAEQLRGEQFSKIVDGAKSLNIVMRTFVSNRRKLNEFVDKDKFGGSQREVAKAEAIACCLNWAKEIEDQINEIQVTRMEVKLLRITVDVELILAETVEILQAAYGLLENFASGMEMGLSDGLVAKEERLSALREKYVETALDGLGK